MADSIPLATEACRSMAIRIQPQELEIPTGNPFEHDLLGRGESIKALTAMIGSIEGPCVMAVDAGWGMGKTTFLRIWAQHLRNERFPVVEFNAWETDFAQDPFIALASEIAAGLQNLGTPSGRLGGQRLRSVAATVARAAPGATARIVASAVPAIGARLAQELEPKPPSLRRMAIENYAETKAALQLFRSSLAEVAKTSAKDNDGRPLVVLVDELDRCRPTYAVELLEAAKHLFNVDRIVFVLCLDRTQLASSVKALYGESFKADGYLWRFFDIDYRLPALDRAKFVDTSLASTGVTDWVRTHQRRGDADPEFLPRLLRHFLSSSDYSLRSVLQAVHRLGAVLAAMPTSNDGNVFVLTILLLLRTIDPSLYQRTIAGEASDIELTERLLGAAGLPAGLSASHFSESWAAVEGLLISCVLLFGADRNGGAADEQLESLKRYQQENDQPDSTTAPMLSQDGHYTSMVLGNVEFFVDVRDPWASDRPPSPRDQKGIKHAVRLLELFSNDVSGTGLV